MRILPCAANEGLQCIAACTFLCDTHAFRKLNMLTRVFRRFKDRHTATHDNARIPMANLPFPAQSHEQLPSTYETSSRRLSPFVFCFDYLYLNFCSGRKFFDLKFLGRKAWKGVKGCELRAQECEIGLSVLDHDTICVTF